MHHGLCGVNGSRGEFCARFCSAAVALMRLPSLRTVIVGEKRPSDRSEPSVEHHGVSTTSTKSLCYILYVASRFGGLVLLPRTSVLYVV